MRKIAAALALMSLCMSQNAFAEILFLKCISNGKNKYSPKIEYYKIDTGSVKWEHFMKYGDYGMDECASRITSQHVV